MAREEKQANIYAIPKNSFDTGYVFGGQFKTRNFVEGVVVTLPFLGIFLYGWAKLGLDFESTVAYCFILCAAVFVSVVHGVGGDSLFEFIARVVKFRQNRRISKYNPRIKTELEPDYLLHDDTMLPKEKLKRALENIKSKVVGGSDEPISADITDEDLQVYYDDDEDFVEKPDELKSKAELKAEAKQRAREEKEFIKSLPRNQRRMARAELKRKHKEESTVAYCFILCAAVFVSVVHGVGGDSLFEFIARVVKFRQNRRISKYNPRIKTELEPDYLLHDDTMLPKEKLKRALENIKSKVVGGSDEPISADITDEDLQVYYDDDEDFVEKPDELKSKAELKAEAKQRAREEKEFIKSLPRNQRRMARAELKRKHKEEAEAAKKREEEREQMIQEAIKHRLEKAERVKAAQMRAHLTALERQRVLEQTQPETVDLGEQAAGVTETVLDVVLDEPADTAVAEPVLDAEVSQEDTTAERPDPELTEKGREVPDQSDTVEDVLEDIELDDDTDLEVGANPSEVLDTSDMLDVELDEVVEAETNAQRKPSFEPRVVRNEKYTERIVKPVKVKPQIRSSRDISIFDDEE